MRCFLAVTLPSSLRSEVERRARSLRKVAPAARWVRPEALHLTLIFLGEQDGERLAELSPRWRSTAASAAPFELRIAGPGAFPARGPCRTLWLGLEPVEPIAAVQRRLARETEAVLGEEALDRRSYHPHVTLARCRKPWPRRWLDESERFFGDLDAAVPVDAVLLVESRLHPDGARYRSVESYPLGEAA